MKSARKISYTVFGFIVFFAFIRSTLTFATGHEPQKIDILYDWRGDYPVSEICRLPEELRLSRIGYINDSATFTDVWKAFKPEDKTPEVDFTSHLVLFARNVVFLNRIGIAAVLFKDGGVQVLAMETMSALPIEDRVSMALAVIPAAGVRYIAVGSQRIPVALHERSSSPNFLNATYRIEGQKISLHNGSSEKPVLPGSAARIITKIFGTPVQGDIDGDGDEDAVVTLVHHPGGSGTFYYVTAAMNLGGQYRTTNAVLLGDRIFPQGIAIVNGIIVARYKDRRVHEPMTSVPSVEKKIYLPYENERLLSIESRETDEQVVAGLRPYTPLFMVLAGKVISSPNDGFGSDHASAFLATELLDVLPRGHCRSNSILVTTPATGEAITSPQLTTEKQEE